MPCIFVALKYVTLGTEGYKIEWPGYLVHARVPTARLVSPALNSHHRPLLSRIIATSAFLTHNTVPWALTRTNDVAMLVNQFLGRK